MFLLIIFPQDKYCFVRLFEYYVDMKTNYEPNIIIPIYRTDARAGEKCFVWI